MNNLIPYPLVKKVESSYDAKAAERILAYIRMGNSFLAACGRANVPPSLAKQWSLYHTTFPQELEIALAERVAQLEDATRASGLDPTGARILLAALASANPEAWSPPAPQKQLPPVPVEVAPQEITINVVSSAPRQETTKDDGLNDDEI